MICTFFLSTQSLVTDGDTLDEIQKAHAIPLPDRPSQRKGGSTDQAEFSKELKYVVNFLIADMYVPTVVHALYINLKMPLFYTRESVLLLR